MRPRVPHVAACARVTKVSQDGETDTVAGPLVYIAAMSDAALPPDKPRSFARRLIPLSALVLAGVILVLAAGPNQISLEALIRHRAEIDAFVTGHRAAAVLAYMLFYVVLVALSVPGSGFLTIAGGFVFGIVIGAGSAVIGATIGATIIFLVARSALGEPLLRRAGPRAVALAQGFRDDAFSYLLFLRLVPAFPFFLVNLVPALAGVRLVPFIAATAIGIIPGALVYAFAGTGLDSVIAMQQGALQACTAAGRADCHFNFNPKDVFTPQLIGALVALGLLALVPVVVKRLRGPRGDDRITPRA